MRLHVLTLSPEAFAWLEDYGVIGRALRSGRITLRTWNPRDHTDDPHRRVDDKPYGGGAGMVLQAEPLARTLEAVRAEEPDLTRVVCLSPQGKRFVQADAERLASLGSSLALVCGRYEGIDERFIEAFADEELSVGDFVLSGGETAALVVLDAVVRLLPGVLGDPASLADESFGPGGGLAGPVYTRPEVWRGRAVPEILLGGDHAAIERWRKEQGRRRTACRRSPAADPGDGGDAPPGG